VVFQSVPVNGEPAQERILPFPESDNSFAGEWKLAQGAPATAAVVAGSSSAVFGIRMKEEFKLQTLFTGEFCTMTGLTAIVLGNTAWAVWRNGVDYMESRIFPA
jgi:hypothetical protein